MKTKHFCFKDPNQLAAEIERFLNAKTDTDVPEHSIVQGRIIKTLQHLTIWYGFQAHHALVIYTDFYEYNLKK